ncbi:hypothetical protein CsSME_00050594 [Camellia sinensis var. sinensis]
MDLDNELLSARLVLEFVAFSRQSIKKGSLYNPFGLSDAGNENLLIKKQKYKNSKDLQLRNTQVLEVGKRLKFGSHSKGLCDCEDGIWLFVIIKEHSVFPG